MWRTILTVCHHSLTPTFRHVRMHLDWFTSPVYVGTAFGLCLSLLVLSLAPSSLLRFSLSYVRGAMFCVPLSHPNTLGNSRKRAWKSPRGRDFAKKYSCLLKPTFLLRTVLAADACWIWTLNLNSWHTSEPVQVILTSLKLDFCINTLLSLRLF